MCCIEVLLEKNIKTMICKRFVICKTEMQCRYILVCVESAVIIQMFFFFFFIYIFSLPFM